MGVSFPLVPDAESAAFTLQLRERFRQQGSGPHGLSAQISPRRIASATAWVRPLTSIFAKRTRSLLFEVGSLHNSAALI